MLLRNLRLVNDNNCDILVDGSRIGNIGAIPGSGNDHAVISFSGELVFPGLINSHDHLDFNNFAQLGGGRYYNYVEWGEYIHAHYPTIINSVQRVPVELRARWGLYKNLLNGVTTVVNHGAKLAASDDLITVFQQCHSMHSVHNEKHWKRTLINPLKRRRPFVIHIGEGCDSASYAEIDELKKWNLLNREIVGVHGIAMDERQAGYFKALVWCPASNFFLIGKTARIDMLKTRIPVVFGTDSTLSAEWSIWSHLRRARSTGFVADRELFDMATTGPAALWGLHNSGHLEAGADADIVVASRGGEGLSAFFSVNPENILLVLRRGKVMLFDARIGDKVRAAGTAADQFSLIRVNGAEKYIYGDLPGLVKQVKGISREAFFPGELGALHEASKK